MSRSDRTQPPRPGAPPPLWPDPSVRAVRFWLKVFAVLYLAFVVYGSLVPLTYRHVPWETALERFRTISYLDLGIGSRADWVANLLLFVPLAFGWAGVIWPRRDAWVRVPAAALTIGASVALAVAIEFAQIYFPPRTVSINDIGAETLGAIIGTVFWWAFGSRAERWFATLPLVRGSTGVAKRLLVAYLILLFGYNLLPLDLTISPVEIYHKWREGKVILIPFSASFESRAQLAYDLITDAAIWAPVAALWRMADRRPAVQAWTLTVLAAAALEILQLFVYSRVTDTTDVFTAAAGALVGAMLARPTGSSAHGVNASRRDGGTLKWAGAVLLWLCVLAVVFWYPFDFNFERSFLRARVEGLGRVPFEAYYYGTEFRAITEVLHKTLFMAPLGVLLYRLGTRLPATWPPTLLHTMALLLVTGCALAIEAGQLPLPGKNADATDWLLESLGGTLGYVGSIVIASQLRPEAERSTRQG